MDPAFKGVGQEPRTWIWRIEKFEVKPIDPSQYGKFYTGDCYIVLKTKLDGDLLVHDIHFWLGSESSQDEWGTAAIKAVELDDSLGGQPVQHREVQGHESKLFLSYYKKGIQYLKGGVASGFRHVSDDDYEPALFQVKGRRNVRVTQVDMKVSSMNRGDCFILDTHDTIYVWAGPKSRRTERLKATQAAAQIRDSDHGGKATIHILDEYADGGLYAAFFRLLGGGSNEDVPPESASDDDVDHERQQKRSVTLYKVSDEKNGTVHIEEIAKKPLMQEMLKTEDCFILDTGAAGFFVWIGRGSTKAEKAAAMDRANKFMAQKGLPAWTRVERVVEDAEPAVFKQYFSRWVDDDAQVGLGRIYSREQIAESVPVSVHLESRPPKQRRHLVQKSFGCALGFMPDDGSGQVEIFRIENFEPVPVPKETYGMFFGGDSYLLKYTYQKFNRDHYVIYFWQGNQSSQDERAAAALHAVKMDDGLCGRAVQVRVVQGREPRHFLTLFKGKMIVFMGGHASGFKNIHDHDTYDVDGTRLFHVCGTSEVDTRAVQVPEETKSLNDDDVFVLETPKQTFIWYGKECCDEERAMADNVASLVSPGRTPVKINQGGEPAEFWAALAGDPSEVQQVTEPTAPPLEKKLIHCFENVAGEFIVEEVEGFEQDDLNEDDVMIVDTGDEVYCWIGKDASRQEKEKTFQYATKYVKSDMTIREDTTVIRVPEAREPPSFKALFPSWDDNMFEKRSAPPGL
ncbi:gelsolin, cytoplasmic-like [Amphibalanus amphitrite]|uniref:gelsolin, cytoplasmic-like n=1 Tax=Amphibalanus amphitrite TaxID=1232801 RepID=UPI001C904957|nr:gelsolin, cytoplasmic-like [Amphibalanus amphitrite]